MSGYCQARWESGKVGKLVAEFLAVFRPGWLVGDQTLSEAAILVHKNNKRQPGLD